MTLHFSWCSSIKSFFLFFPSHLSPISPTLSSVADERDRVQKKTFTKWVNKHLIKVQSGMPCHFIGFLCLLLIRTDAIELSGRSHVWNRCVQATMVQDIKDMHDVQNIFQMDEQ